jgi:hypothetical protein
VADATAIASIAVSGSVGLAGIIAGALNAHGVRKQTSGTGASGLPRSLTIGLLSSSEGSTSGWACLL